VKWARERKWEIRSGHDEATACTSDPKRWAFWEIGGSGTCAEGVSGRRCTVFTGELT
jgi:hypothetical protein